MKFTLPWTNINQADPETDVDEIEEDRESEEFTPFTCRKCGKLVTKPYENCEEEQQ